MTTKPVLEPKMAPPIGCIVQRPGGRDRVAMVRIGEEQGVLVWGQSRERFQKGDVK